MATLTVTAKGQVTLRRELLNHLGIAPGEQITLHKAPDGLIEMRAAKRSGKISDVFGRLASKDGPVFTIDEINRVIEDGWSGRR